MTTEDRAPLNSLPLDRWELNQPDIDLIPCEGISLTQLRSRLRAMLSSYAPNTLLPNDFDNDLESQYINDGIDQLWPHDYQIVMYSQQIVDKQTRYYLPDDCEHVISMWTGDLDVNEQGLILHPMAHYDQWMFDSAFIDASTFTTASGAWTDTTKKTVVLDKWAMNPLWTFPQQHWLITRYARKWNKLLKDNECINPTGNRVQSIIYYAAHEYFNSQYEVNSESIRYQNYLGIANRLYQLFMQQLTKDSKPLYIS